MSGNGNGYGGLQPDVPPPADGNIPPVQQTRYFASETTVSCSDRIEAAVVLSYHSANRWRVLRDGCSAASGPEIDVSQVRWESTSTVIYMEQRYHEVDSP